MRQNATSLASNDKVESDCVSTVASDSTTSSAVCSKAQWLLNTWVRVLQRIPLLWFFLKTCLVFLGFDFLKGLRASRRPLNLLLHTRDCWMRFVECSIKFRLPLILESILPELGLPSGLRSVLHSFTCLAFPDIISFSSEVNLISFS